MVYKCFVRTIARTSGRVFFTMRSMSMHHVQLSINMRTAKLEFWTDTKRRVNYHNALSLDTNHSEFCFTTPHSPRKAGDAIVMCHTGARTKKRFLTDSSNTITWILPFFGFIHGCPPFVCAKKNGNLQEFKFMRKIWLVEPWSIKRAALRFDIKLHLFWIIPN